MELMSRRNKTIDVLRTLGTFFVILAHVNPPTTVGILRSFDVCLLVMISGYCCSFKEKSYGSYLVNRIRRLCIPAWFTASIIFLLCAVLSVVAKQPFLYSIRQIIETYTFIGGIEGGIGLFWIVRIYLLVAIFTPTIIAINKKVKNNVIFLMGCIGVLFVNEVLFLLMWGKNVSFNFILENYIMSTLAYSSVFAIGYKIKNEPKVIKPAFIISVVLFVCVFIPLLIKNGGYVVSEYKYPPRLAYILFGIVFSLLVWLIVDWILKKYDRCPKWIIWFSVNAYNIYFAHAVVLKLLSWGDRLYRNNQLMHNWLFIYLLVLVTSIFLTLCLNKILNLMKKLEKIAFGPA